MVNSLDDPLFSSLFSREAKSQDKCITNLKKETLTPFVSAKYYHTRTRITIKISQRRLKLITVAAAAATSHVPQLACCHFFSNERELL